MLEAGEHEGDGARRRLGCGRGQVRVDGAPHLAHGCGRGGRGQAPGILDGGLQRGLTIGGCVVSQSQSDGLGALHHPRAEQQVEGS
eukprot:scaffold19909_cov130-Isochrysis_galbana.AAC.3